MCSHRTKQTRYVYMENYSQIHPFIYSSVSMSVRIGGGVETSRFSFHLQCCRVSFRICTHIKLPIFVCVFLYSESVCLCPRDECIPLPPITFIVSFSIPECVCVDSYRLNWCMFGKHICFGRNMCKRLKKYNDIFESFISWFTSQFLNGFSFRFTI